MKIIDANGTSVALNKENITHITQARNNGSTIFFTGGNSLTTDYSVNELVGILYN